MHGRPSYTIHPVIQIRVHPMKSQQKVNTSSTFWNSGLYFYPDISHDLWLTPVPTNKFFDVGNIHDGCGFTYDGKTTPEPLFNGNDHVM